MSKQKSEPCPSECFGCHSICEDPCTSTTRSELFSAPILVETTVKEKTIELIYKEEPNSNYTYPFATPETQVYKLIYSRFDGSVKREEGIWIEPSEGHYIFD